jgi:hypothetical protein
MVILLFSLSSHLWADEDEALYKRIDKKGQVFYSDQPSPNAKKIIIKDITPIRVIPSTENKVLKLSEVKIKEQLITPSDALVTPSNYTDVGFILPEPQGVIRNNEERGSFRLKIEPVLNPKHQIYFYIDNQLIRSTSATNIVVSPLAYGVHSAYFLILDEKKTILKKSESLNFTLLHQINPNNKQKKLKYPDLPSSSIQQKIPSQSNHKGQK